MISDSNFISDDGISIPCKYTSYLAPLTSSKLWNETRACKDPGKIPEVNKKFKKYLSYNLKCMFRCNLFLRCYNYLQANFETPYVVHLHNCNVLTESKPVFTFHHPNKGLTFFCTQIRIKNLTVSTQLYYLP